MEFWGVTTTEATAGGPFPVGVPFPQARKGTALINVRANAKRDLKAGIVMKAHTCSPVVCMPFDSEGVATRMSLERMSILLMRLTQSSRSLLCS